MWDTPPDDMSAGIALLDRTLVEIVVAYDGVRPVSRVKATILWWRSPASVGKRDPDFAEEPDQPGLASCILTTPLTTVEVQATKGRQEVWRTDEHQPVR